MIVKRKYTRPTIFSIRIDNLFSISFAEKILNTCDEVVITEDMKILQVFN